MASGWIVRVRTRQLGGGPNAEELFIVAEPDKDKAVEIIRKGVKTTTDQHVDAVSELSEIEMAGHNLKPGIFKKWV